MDGSGGFYPCKLGKVRNASRNLIFAEGGSRADTEGRVNGGALVVLRHELGKKRAVQSVRTQLGVALDAPPFFVTKNSVESLLQGCFFGADCSNMHQVGPLNTKRLERSAVIKVFTIYRKPRNLRIRTIPTVRCRRRLSRALFNRNHGSEANSTSRKCAISSSRDVFQSSFFNSTSAHVDREKPVVGVRTSSFSQVPVATPPEGPRFSWSSQGSCGLLSSKPPQAKGVLPKIKGSWEKSHVGGGNLSGINRFRIYSTNCQDFAERNIATTGTTRSSFELPRMYGFLVMFRTERRRVWNSRCFPHRQRSAICS